MGSLNIDFRRTDVHIRAVLNKSRDRLNRFEKPSAAVMFKLRKIHSVYISVTNSLRGHRLARYGVRAELI